MDERGWWQRQSSTTGARHTGRESGSTEEAEVARRHAARRARRLAVYGGGVLATAVVIGAVAAITQITEGSVSSMPPVAGGSAPTPAPARPATTEPREEPGGTQQQGDGMVTAGRPVHSRDEAETLIRDTEDFRFGLFGIAAEYLDPEKRYLNYATRSLQSSSDGAGGRALGIRLGWKVPGEPGEGMVQIAVSDMTGPDRPRCGEHLEMDCQTVLLPNGESVERGGADGGVYDVLYRRDDGVSVHVRIDPLFGNNSLVPVEEMRIDPGDVYRLVQDERIGLPELW